MNPNVMAVAQRHRERTERGGGVTGRLAEFVDVHAASLYWPLVAIFVGMFGIAAHILSLESDEAQILLSSAQTFGVEVPVTINFGKPTITTGGLHLLAHGLLARVTADIFVHRLISLTASVALLAMVYRALRSLGHPTGRAVAGLALFAATPGFITQAGLAMGEAIATPLLIGAAIHWVRRDVTSWPAAATTGLLLGVACATRVNCAAAIPGFFAYAVFLPQGGERAIRKALFATGVAGLVAGVSVGAYYLSATILSPTDAQAYLGATGLDAAKPIGRMLRSIRVLNEYLPLFVIAGIVGGWAMTRDKNNRSTLVASASDLAGILLFMGLGMMGFWLLLAPIPHLRYLWPTLPCIWLAGVMLLLGNWHLESIPARLTLHGIVLAACGSALTGGILTLANAESLTVAYQAMGVAPRIGPSVDERFQAGEDQRRLALFMKSRDAKAEFFVPTIGFGFPLSYLSGREVQPISNITTHGEQFILISPPDYTIWHPEPLFLKWLHRHAKLAFRSRGYAAFRLSDHASTPPRGRYSVGESDFFEDRLDRCFKCFNTPKADFPLSPRIVPINEHRLGPTP